MMPAAAIRGRGRRLRWSTLVRKTTKPIGGDENDSATTPLASCSESLASTSPRVTPLLTSFPALADSDEQIGAKPRGYSRIPRRKVRKSWDLWSMEGISGGEGAIIVV